MDLGLCCAADFSASWTPAPPVATQVLRKPCRHPWCFAACRLCCMHQRALSLGHLRPQTWTVHRKLLACQQRLRLQQHVWHAAHARAEAWQCTLLASRAATSCGGCSLERHIRQAHAGMGTTGVPPHTGASSLTNARKCGQGCRRWCALHGGGVRRLAAPRIPAAGGCTVGRLGRLLGPEARRQLHVVAAGVAVVWPVAVVAAAHGRTGSGGPGHLCMPTPILTAAASPGVWRPASQQRWLHALLQLQRRRALGAAGPRAPGRRLAEGVLVRTGPWRLLLCLGGDGVLGQDGAPAQAGRLRGPRGRQLA